jgi:ABC-type multidrug transport system fused ATPase/permease subunit
VADYMKRDAMVRGFFQMLSNVCLMGIMGAVFYYAVWLANQGIIGFTEAMGPLFVITGAMVPMMKASALADIANATKTAIRLFDMFDRVPQIDSSSEDGRKPDTCQGEVEVKDVAFAYPTAPGHMVCNGFSLRIPAGQTMALCGASGSGKSTLIQLLERFYDPLSGVVTLDGVVSPFQ